MIGQKKKWERRQVIYTLSEISELQVVSLVRESSDPILPTVVKISISDCGFERQEFTPIYSQAVSIATTRHSCFPQVVAIQVRLRNPVRE